MLYKNTKEDPWQEVSDLMVFRYYLLQKGQFVFFTITEKMPDDGRLDISPHTRELQGIGNYLFRNVVRTT